MVAPLHRRHSTASNKLQQRFTREQKKVQQQKPAEVFISYQHDKQKQILALYKKLASLGYTCWIDKNEIQGGKVLLEEISKGLRGCKVVLCCLTQKYTESKVCRQEIQLANAINVHIIPLKLESGLQYPPPGPMDLILAGLTYIDFFKPNDSIQNNWNCPQFDELKQQIDVLINKESEPEVVITQTEVEETKAQDVPAADNIVPPTAQLLRGANNNHKQQKPTTDENGLPLPSPHKMTKDQLFKISNFSKLDSRACEVPRDLYNELLSELVEYLVVGTKTELERVRVVYRWITAQDLSRWRFSGSATMTKRPETVQDYIFALKNEYISYHGLMAEMCSYIRIATKEIIGYVKHAKYEPGDELTDDDKGSWTAVLIDGAWFLMNVLFSSRSVTGIKSMWTLVVDNGEDAKGAKEDGVETEQYDYDEYYFLVNPKELIFSHLPLDENWQLLSRKVTLEEFRQFVFVKPQFFQSKLELVHPCTSVVNIPDGVIDVNVRYPMDSSGQFAYRLWLANDRDVDLSATHNDLHLKDFVFMQSREGILSFHIEFPTPGKFKLEVFSTNTVADLFYPACSFTMVVRSSKKDAKPLPSNDFGGWGPTQKVEALGMKPLTHTNGHVKAKGGEAELRFTAPAAEITVLPTLHSDSLTAKQLEKNVIHRIEDDQVIINVRVPDKGDYVLDIFAKEKGTGKEGSIPHVCSYLLSADRAAENPAGFPDQLGPLASGETNLRLTALSHPTSIFRAPLEGEVVMTFDVYCLSASFTLRTELGLSKKNELVPCNEFTYVSTHSRKSGGGGTATISARFPETGTYNLKIYERESGSNSQPLYLVYSYEIYVSREMENCSPFPVTMVGWNDESCEMIQPKIDQPLLANTTVTFRVKILKAGGVFVQSSDDDVQTTLSRAADDEAGVWTGEVATGNTENCLTLFANFNKDSRASYNGLLKFNVGAGTMAAFQCLPKYGRSNGQ